MYRISCSTFSNFVRQKLLWTLQSSQSKSRKKQQIVHPSQVNEMHNFLSTCLLAISLCWFKCPLRYTFSLKVTRFQFSFMILAARGGSCCSLTYVICSSDFVRYQFSFLQTNRSLELSFVLTFISMHLSTFHSNRCRTCDSPCVVKNWPKMSWNS